MGFLHQVTALVIIAGLTQGLPSSLASDVAETDLHDVEKRAVSSYTCLTKLYVMAFTSGLQHAGSNAGHAIEVLAGGHVRSLRLYDRPGDDMLEHKGDLWEFNFSSFGFPFHCVRKSNIQSVSIIERSDDGWNIASVVTLVRDSNGGVGVLTENFNVNRWIDGNDHHSHRRFQLNRV